MSTSSTPARPVSRGREVRTGLRDATPLALGALPFGLLFGAVAQQADLSLLDTMLLSALVNGGSAQMIATGLMASGTVWFVVVATCLVVNMRHVFYSAALSAKVRHLPTLWRVVLAYGLIDAIYVLAAKRYEIADGRRGQQHWYVLAASLLMYVGWLSSTLVGFLFGKDVTRIDGLGLDFAIYATYIGLVVSCFTSKRAVAAGLVGGALALALHRLPYQSGLFCATLAATVTLALWEGRARADDCTPGSPEQEPTAKG